MNRDEEYLRQILDAILQIEQYASVGQDPFLSKTLRQDATIRQLIVIGEATKRVSPELKTRYPSLSWREAAGLRDFLIHHYPKIELEVVWRVTQDSLPEFKSGILDVLHAEGWSWNPTKN